jgi:hypothetical protein
MGGRGGEEVLRVLRAAAASAAAVEILRDEALAGALDAGVARDEGGFAADAAVGGDGLDGAVDGVGAAVVGEGGDGAGDFLVGGGGGAREEGGDAVAAVAAEVFGVGVDDAAEFLEARVEFGGGWVGGLCGLSDEPRSCGVDRGE